jgi:hypothetical protein
MRKLRSLGRSALALAAASLIAEAASAVGILRITEWMYNGDEFIEFTNVGDEALDLTGWSFDDNSRLPGTVSLSAFGVVAAGESVILSEADAATFRTQWGLASSVDVIGGNTTNLGRADEINLYDASATLIDRLTYDDQTIGGLRTLNLSGNIARANLGANAAALAVASVVGDEFGTVASLSGFLANPGRYPVPEPAAALLLGAAGVGLRMRRDTRRA